MKSFPFDRLKNSNARPIVAFFACVLIPSGFADDSQNSLWQDIGPSLSLRGAYWGHDKTFSPHTGFLSTSAWLSLRPREIAAAKFFFEGYVAKNDTTRRSPSKIEAREAYIEKSFGDFDLRVGRQIVVWGRADKVNPTDQWTSKDLTLLSTDDEDQRLGTAMLTAAWNFGSYRIIGLYVPEWRAPMYPIPPIAGISLANLTPSSPARQFALKIDQTGGSFDWSLSYSNVISKLPTLDVLSAGPDGTRIGLNYEHVEVFGADFAMNFGRIGLRAESAYTLAPDSNGNDPTKFNRELFTVLGADHSPIENLNFNLQVLYKHVFQYRTPNSFSDSSMRLLAAQENLVANQLDSNQFGLSFRPNFKMMNETLELEAAYVQWFGVPGGLVRPKATYAFNDHFKGCIGAEKYFGTNDSFFGRLSNLSSFFTELRYSF